MKKVKENLKVKKFLKVMVWSVILFIILIVGVAIGGSDNGNVKTIVNDCPKCEVVNNVDCPKCENVDNFKKAISFYEQILILDGEAFKVAAQSTLLIPRAFEAGYLGDLTTAKSITAILNNNTNKVNDLAIKKDSLISQINLLIN